MVFLVHSVRHVEFANPKFWVTGVTEKIQLKDKPVKRWLMGLFRGDLESNVLKIYLFCFTVLTRDFQEYMHTVYDKL